MENQSASKEPAIKPTIDQEAFVYMVMPFQLITKNGNNQASAGNLFDEVTGQQHHVSANDFLEMLSKWSVQSKKYPAIPGDFSKYYGFMRNHFGNAGDSSELIVFQLDTTKLIPAPGFESFKNMQAQFSKGAWLGQSEIRMNEMNEVHALLNPTAGFGFFIFGFECNSSENNISDALTQTVFFRNIGWRRNQKLGVNQIQKNAWIFDRDSKFGMTMYQALQCYFAELSDCIRFYQDRATVMYSVASVGVGSKSDAQLCEQAYEIIRVPDRNAPRFDQPLTEPTIHRVGRNVAFTALNEGALIIETINETAGTNAIAKKYFPAFILTLIQSESLRSFHQSNYDYLLNTMQSIAYHDASELTGQNEAIFNKMEILRNRLLILQLKHISSVSHLREVELFFNQFQKLFAVEKMLMENDQCIREVYNLLEVRRNKEIERIEKEKAERDERRSNIINTILGAIGCLGLFSFLKDVIPFYEDDKTYEAWYRFISICLPVLVMAYIVRLVFYSKK